MLRYAIDRGVNYLDSAHGYHGGNSERVIANALQGGYRDKVRIATKLPTWAVKERSDFDRFLDEQRSRLQTDRIDFYLLHNLQAAFWPRVRDLGVLDWLERIKADGRVGGVGFSYHDSFELFREIVDAYDGWALCQIQYNFVNERVQAGTRGLCYAAEKGLAVAVMEPLLGGCLANPPEPIRAIWESAPVRRTPADSPFGVPPSGGPVLPGRPTPADWALQWVWNKPEVAVVLSGMTAMQHVVENVASACRSGVGSLTDAELELFARVREQYETLYPVPCTRCGYCMPCPTGVDIPRAMQLYNDARVFGGGHVDLNRNLYRQLPEPARASACTACRTCEEKCPQSIKVSEWMPRIHEFFGK
jgi:hypothetical protein